MKNSKLKSAARVTGVFVFLAGLCYGQTFNVTIQLQGDLSDLLNPVYYYARAIHNPKSIITTNDSSPIGGYNVGGISNLSIDWWGNISVSPVNNTLNNGFSVSPKFIEIVTGNKDTTLYFTVKDTTHPVVKIKPLKDTTLCVGKPFMVYDSIKDNSGRIKFIRHDISIDNGQTWDSLSLEQWTAPNYFKCNHYYLVTAHTFIFTPQVISNNLWLRVIVADYFHGLQDTDVVILKTRADVGIKNFSIAKTTFLQIKSVPFDLLGKRIKYYSVPKICVTKYQTRLTGLLERR